MPAKISLTYKEHQERFVRPHETAWKRRGGAASGLAKVREC